MITLQVLNGLVYGSLLLIMTSGLVLIYGLRRIVNFAHGSLYMLGAYVGFTVTNYANQWVALVAAAMVLALVGFLLDRYGLRFLQDREPLTAVIVTFGLLLILEDAVQSIWGKEYYTVDAPAILSGSIPLLGVSFPVYRLIIIIAGTVITGGLIFWLRFTRMGLFIRAASTDPVTTAMQGVNTDRISGGVVALGAALAGIAGVIASPFLSLSPTMGGDIIIDSFVVIVIGGLGSFGGAFIAAMILGQVQTLGSVYLPEFASVLPFILMLFVLITKPSGIAGSRV
ncbi:MAG: branched-chain amino acid ABC transporter permease [Desulfuromonadaceae bacterium]